MSKPDIVAQLRYWAGNGDTESQACMLRAATTLEWYIREHEMLVNDLISEAKRAAYIEQKLLSCR